MDYNRLIVAGHSMGGATALKVASKEFRARCCLTLDPWMFPLQKDIKEGKLKIANHVPVFLANTSSFHGMNKPIMDHLSIFTKLKEYLNGQKTMLEDVTLLNMEHAHQNDHVIVNPLFKDRVTWKEFVDSGYKKLPRTHTHMLVQGQCWLMLSFLYRVKMHQSTFLPKNVEEELDKVRDEIVQYNQKFSWK